MMFAEKAMNECNQPNITVDVLNKMLDGTVLMAERGITTDSDILISTNDGFRRNFSSTREAADWIESLIPMHDAYLNAKERT